MAKPLLPEIPADQRILPFDPAADFLGISNATLRREIDLGRGPKKIQLSARRVGFRVGDLKQWLKERTF
jgi:predicted DNA-binding transcriptional regulator AlpA